MFGKIKFGQSTRILGLLVLAAVLVMAISCRVETDRTKGQPFVPYVTDQVVIDAANVLRDGQGMAWKLEKGKYKLEMTANNDGATAEFVGGGCPKTEPMRAFSMICEMPGTGQLVITNPTVFALGKDVSVTVKLTKLAQ